MNIIVALNTFFVVRAVVVKLICLHYITAFVLESHHYVG